MLAERAIDGETQKGSTCNSQVCRTRRRWEKKEGGVQRENPPELLQVVRIM